MKKTKLALITMISLSLMIACNKMTYRKTKSGLVYNIFPSSGKDSLMKVGQYAKFNFTTKLNDSVLYTSYGKAPGYAKLLPAESVSYNILEIFPMMKKGDSAVTIQIIDSLLKRGDQQVPPTAKKGDKMTIAVKILEVFSDDSAAFKDYNAEMEKDRPRQMKEQEEQMAKMKKEREAQEAKDEAELEKSGEIQKEIQNMETYLKGKNINAQKTGKGTFVYVKEQGNGSIASAGKYVKVKYTGYHLETDSVFQSNEYAFQLGVHDVIRGWDEGLQLFKQGGKGTLYIPGFLAYGKNPPPNSPFKIFEPLKFDVEMLQVSDTPIQ